MKTNYLFKIIFVLCIGACSVKEQASNIEASSAEKSIIPNSEYDYPDGLHPNAVTFLKKSPPRNYDTLKIPVMRAGLKLLGARLFGSAQEGVIITNDTVRTSEADIPIRIYKSETANTKEKLPAIVFYHGGAWCFGGLNMVDFFATSLTKKMDVIFVSVDYRLAPEYPYPAAIDDSYAALNWVVEMADSLGIDANNISVSGGSAGGNIAAVVAMKARDENGVKIKSQLLLYPATDLHNLNTYSYKIFGQNFGLQEALMTKSINAYVPKEDRNQAYVSPLLAESVGELPPALVITAGFDPLRDEGEAYAKRMQDAGVSVKLSRYDSMVHGFVTFAKVYPKQSNQVIEEMVAYLKGE